MTECPTCKLSMESHSTSELMECCMKQVNDELVDEKKGVCPNCKHEIAKFHTSCENCGTKFPPCIASGKPIGQSLGNVQSIPWTCKVCRHKALEKELRGLATCPLCHSMIV